MKLDKLFKIDKYKKEYNKLRSKENRTYFCLAPFVAMRLNCNNAIQACCHQSESVLINNRTLKETWFGEEMQEMRKDMYKFKIPKSCGFCASNYYANNFANVDALSFDYLEKMKNKNGYPSLMKFYFGNTCNLSCLMCDSSLSSSIQNNKSNTANNDFVCDDNFLNQITEFIPYLKIATFIGGEPFLIKDFYKLWEIMININPKIIIHITTNASIYNDKIEKLLNKGNFEIEASIDSFNPDNYQTIRCGANYNTTMSNAESFAEICKKNNTNFTISVCPLIINKYDMPDMLRKCNTKNWNIYFNTVLKPWNLALYSLKSKELSELIAFYENQYFENTNTTIAINNVNKYNLFISMLKTWLNKLYNYEEININTDFSTKRSEIKNLITNKLNLNDSEDNIIIYNKINSVINNLPDIILSDTFIQSINDISYEMLSAEIQDNDTDTIINHLCFYGFNLLP